MIEFLQNLTWWHWIVGALVLGALETFMPGAVAIWFAASAAVIGLLLVVVPLPWQWQWVLFAALGLVAMVWYRYYKKSHPDIEERPTLNRRGEQYVGRVFTLVEPIDQGYGKVRVGDGVWKVAGPDAPAGTAVRVVAADGAILRVEVT
jgi:membrane protein implicated in regulation of membrane protease activity